MDCCRYKVVLDLIFAFVSFVAFMWLIYVFSSLVIESSKHDEFTTDYIVQVSLGLSVGVILFIASIVYFCVQYRNYTRKKTMSIGSVDSGKYKPITVLAGSQCAICLTEKDTRKTSVVSLSCKHAFHKDCVQPWIDKMTDATCPVCRIPSTTFPKSERDQAKTEETSFLRIIEL